MSEKDPIVREHPIPFSYRTGQIIIVTLAILAGIPWFLNFWFHGVLAILGTFLTLKLIESTVVGEHHYSTNVGTGMITAILVFMVLAVDVYLPFTME